MFHRLDTDVSLEEINKGIQQLKLSKSAGPDNYLNEYFIHGNTVLILYLQSLFNVIFKTGYFTETWSEWYIVPLHKKGSINNPENYRGITLLSVLGKLFTRILTSWAESLNVYIEAQAGFRSGMSISDNIFVLTWYNYTYDKSRKKLYCSFIDFSKAFDYVERNSLWSKLIKLGIRGKMMTILKSMYSSVKSRVRFNNKLNHEFFCF